LVNYAIALLKVGRYQDSVDVSREYLRREPKGKHASAALSNIGIALTKLGKVKDAEVVFRESLNLEPSEPKTYVNLVALLRDQKRFIEGLKWVEIALQLIDGDNWRPRLLEDMAWLLLHLGRSEEAIDAATKCLLLQPDRIYTRYLLALGLSNMGRFEEALAETRTV
jgi:tetratricopeptide (TPR) repeat protein